MQLLVFLLGMIFGGFLTSIVIATAYSFQGTIQRVTQQAYSYIPREKAYIVGLSDEEQAFKDSLNVDNRDTKLV